MARIAIPAIAAASIALMLLRPRRLPEAVSISSGALLLVLLRLVPLALAAHAIAEGLDVYLFLTGMMLLAELARIHGVFDWLAAIAVRSAAGSRQRLFALLYTVGTLVTVFMSNDATAVVLTPAVLTAIKRARPATSSQAQFNPLPYLFICAFIANAASFVLPISNPANLVVFRSGMPPLLHWLAAFTLPSLLSIGSTYLLLRWYFRRELAGTLPSLPSHAEGDPSPPTAAGKLTLIGIFAVAGVLLAASALGRDLGLPTCIAAFATAAVVSLRARTSPARLLRGISWSVLPLVAGLFVLVEAINSIGALHLAGRALAAVSAWPPIAGALTTSFVVGIGNNLINNLPLGLIAGSTLQAAHLHGLLANAVLVGVDLGPNLSVTGSLATILWLIALRREGMDVGAVQFLKAGLLIMPPALLLSTLALLLHG